MRGKGKNCVRAHKNDETHLNVYVHSVKILTKFNLINLCIEIVIIQYVRHVCEASLQQIPYWKT